MLKNWKIAAFALALSATMFGAGAAYTAGARAQVAAPPPPGAYNLRGERGSARNLIFVRTRLESAIDQLQRDRRDYGGHREQAIDPMLQSRVQIIDAIEWDATHPNG